MTWPTLWHTNRAHCSYSPSSALGFSSQLLNTRLRSTFPTKHRKNFPSRALACLQDSCLVSIQRRRDTRGMGYAGERCRRYAGAPSLSLILTQLLIGPSTDPYPVCIHTRQVLNRLRYRSEKSKQVRLLIRKTIKTIKKESDNEVKPKQTRGSV